jgi:RecA/RadA recombinase
METKKKCVSESDSPLPVASGLSTRQLQETAADAIATAASRRPSLIDQLSEQFSRRDLLLMSESPFLSQQLQGQDRMSRFVNRQWIVIVVSHGQ